MTAQTKATSPWQGFEVAHNSKLNPQFKHTRRALQAVLAPHGLWMVRT